MEPDPRFVVRPPEPEDGRGAIDWRGPAVIGGVVVLLVVLLLVIKPWRSDDDTPAAGVVDTSWLDDKASGDVVYCSGTDVSGSQKRSVRDFNESPDGSTTFASFVDNISPRAEKQRRAYLDRMRQGACDVVYLDVVYTPEFAARKLLYDMTPYLEQDDRKASFDRQMMSTLSYGGKLWGVPKQLDGGVLYYRRDKQQAPRTWKALAAAAQPDPGERPRLRFQLDAYEGLTVTFLEIAYAAGAEPIVSDDGKTANVDQPETVAALRFLQRLIRRRAVPASVTRLGDRGSLWAFGVGRAAFLRAWPYVEARLTTDARTTTNATRAARQNTARNFGVVSLPPWTPEGQAVGILGGHNLVIPRTAKNPRGALRLIKFLTREDQVLKDAEAASMAPVLSTLWTRDEVTQSAALTAVRGEDLRLRPLIPRYWQVSREIYCGLRGSLVTGAGDSSLQDIQLRVQRVLDGRAEPGDETTCPP
jgi:multiple sugar transport system substrate-binding protein